LWTGEVPLAYTGHVERTVRGRTGKRYTCVPLSNITVTGADVEALCSLGWFREKDEE